VLLCGGHVAVALLQVYSTIITVGSNNFNLVKILHILYTNQSINQSIVVVVNKKKMFWAGRACT
jgi:hypothetical protein